MTKLTTTVIVALMVMALAITSASAATSVEVRGTVFDANSASYEINATNFAGFYYDLDDDISTETMTILSDLTNSDRSIGENELVYTTTIEGVDYTSDNFDGQFNVMGLFAEKYIPLTDTTPDKLSKLLLDSDDKYTLRTGTALELPEGYALTAKQIDVEGDKVWVEFTKDGEFVEDEILDVSNGTVVWTYEADDVADEDDVPVLKVAVTNVFQGQVDSLAVVEGVWLMDYENVLEIEDEDTFDKLEVATIGTDSLTLNNSNSMTLTKDKDISIAQGMSFRVANSDALRFFIMKEYTESGTYEIRGEVVEGDGVAEWDYSNFAGFYYDLDDNISSEVMSVDVNGRSIGEGNLTYVTTIQQIDFAAEDVFTEQYNVIGFFAEKYIPLTSTTPDKLSKLLLDSDDKYTLRTGTALELPEGYALTAKQIDVEGDKVWIEFTKDGEFVEDEILDVSNGTAVWTYEADDVADEDDVPVMKVAVTNVFQGQVDSLAVVEGVWLMDYENVLEIEDEDAFDKLEVSTIGTDSLTLSSSNSMTLTANKDISIAQGMSFRVADSSDLRYYPFVEMTIDGDNVTQPDDDEDGNETVDGNETPVDGNETPVDGNETPVDGNETPVDGNETPAEPSPGFEVIFAVAGLLAVAYLVRRN